MTDEQIRYFSERIDQLTSKHKPLFGIMNANQMVCHCTDQIRLAIGTFMAEEYGTIDLDEILAISKSGKTVPSPKGLGQVEGGGTKSTNFVNDVKMLKEHILNFSQLTEDFHFKPHPYFGICNKDRWTAITIKHLNHHLHQFKV